MICRWFAPSSFVLFGSRFIARIATRARHEATHVAAGWPVVTRLRHDRDTTSLEGRGTKDQAEAHYIELVRGVARTTSRMGRVVIDVAEGGPQDLSSSVPAYDLYESLAAKCRAAVRVNRQGGWRDVAVHLHLQHLTPGSKRKTARPSRHHALEASACRSCAKPEL